MKYSGRIVIISVVIVTIVALRTYGTMYYNFPTLQFPVAGVFILLASWVLGTQYDRLKFLSEKDNLTTLYNRRFILEAFPKLISSVERRRGQLILYFIDVDNFKLINDSRGHKIGDQVLQRIANVLLLDLQKKDLAARWAGDEFLILSASTDASKKAVLISHIQNELMLASREFNLEISVSIGTAVYPDEARSLDDLLHAADLDMYSLKSDRKNTNIVVESH
ncbi:GGDEF domain-containing protein [Paenibacillus sp. LjRoot153]|uniref:GGDEF domain-containing protein n=1 Tax=Paenibacillus sp. LjRoot153 TaxID=3342270 RepID=UPI003ED0AF28